MLHRESTRSPPEEPIIIDLAPFKDQPIKLVSWWSIQQSVREIPVFLSNSLPNLLSVDLDLSEIKHNRNINYMKHQEDY